MDRASRFGTTTHGWRPISVKIQPKEAARKGRGEVDEGEEAQQLVGGGLAAAGGPQTPRSQQEGHHAQADHESEGPEGHHLRGTEVELRGITVLGGENSDPS